MTVTSPSATNYLGSGFEWREISSKLVPIVSPEHMLLLAPTHTNSPVGHTVFAGGPPRLG